MSARGISLHIAVNHCDPDHYNGWSGPLKSCEHDADTMQGIARARGFETNQLKTEQATRDGVKQAIKNAARELNPGDIFLVTYSGHGNQVPDVTGDEEDNEDDTWCLHDGQLLDDELLLADNAFNKIADGHDADDPLVIENRQMPDGLVRHHGHAFFDGLVGPGADDAF